MARKKKKLSAAEKKKRKDKRRRKREQLLNDFQQPKQVSGKPGLGGREYPPKEIRNAIIRAARGVAESERTPDQWYSLGSLLVYEGCLEEDDALLDQGLNALLQAAEAEPPIGLAVLDLSWVFALKGLHSMALQYAKKACTLLPDNQDAWRFCANAYVAMGMREEAIECMERASKVSEPFPRDLEYLETLKNGKPLGRCFVVSYGIQANLVEGNHNLSQEELKLLRFETKQLAKSLEDKEELTLTLAQLSWQLGDIDGALKTLAELTATNPEHANANAFLGRLYDLKRNKEQAIHHYNRALANSPDEAFLVMSLTNLAKHLLDDDEPHAARNLLEAAMTIAPDYGVAFHLYGNSVARLEGDFELELTYHEKAVELCPDKVGVLVSHLMCLMSLNRLEDLRTTFQAYKSKFTGDVGDFHFPLELMRTYLEPPEDLDGCIFFANTFLRLNPSAASRFIELAVEKCDSGNAGEYENSLGYLGMLASQAKDHELVLRIFEEAHRVSGNNIHNANSAVALAALGRVKEALEMIETCDPNEERVLTIKGNLLWDAGQLQEACLTYRQAIEVDRHYVLPYHHGFETAWRVGDLQLAREFAIELEKVQNVDDDRQTLTLGRMQRALGDPFKAVETLSGLLESRARTSAPQRSEDGLESVYLEDRELTETWKTSDSEIRYDLACSYIFARDFRSFEDLWAQRVNEPGRDWITLWAEMLRLKGRFADVVDFLTKPENELELIPPRLITKALAELSQGLQEAAVETLKQAEDFGERRWEHPLGEQAALIQGLKATAALQSGDELRATELCSSQKRIIRASASLNSRMPGVILMARSRCLPKVSTDTQAASSC